MMTTDAPASYASIAAANPAAPLPTTTTSAVTSHCEERVGCALRGDAGFGTWVAATEVAAAVTCGMSEDAPATAPSAAAPAAAVPMNCRLDSFLSVIPSVICIADAEYVP